VVREHQAPDLAPCLWKHHCSKWK